MFEFLTLRNSAHFVSTTKRRYDLQRYQTKNGTFGAKNSRKSQKSPIFDRKCSYLVMLRSGNSAWNRKSLISGSGQSYQKSLSICTFCAKKWRFLAFSRIFFVKYPQKHLVYSSPSLNVNSYNVISYNVMFYSCKKKIL